MRPERRVALREDGIMEGPHRELSALPIRVVTAQLQHHELTNRVDKISRIEGTALRFATRRRFFEKRLVTKEAHPLFHRQILAVQADAYNAAGQTHQRLGKLP